MDPPIHTEYFLSGGAMILILMVDGAKAVISFCILSAIPGYMVVPPDMTVLAYKSLRTFAAPLACGLGSLIDVQSAVWRAALVSACGALSGTCDQWKLRAPSNCPLGRAHPM